MGDETYIDQPRLMAKETISSLAMAVSRYIQKSEQKGIHIIFHGGEPLLAPMSFYEQFIDIMASSLPNHFIIKYSMQTNGTLLTDAWVEFLTKKDIGYGISLDGSQRNHDQFRVNHAGHGSYQRVVTGIKRSLERKKRTAPFGGVLTVINLDDDPLEIVAEYQSLGLLKCDFLLPDGNYDKPPPKLGEGLETPYADWLIKLFDHWFDIRPRGIQIQIFSDIFELIFSPSSGGDSIGTGENNVIVIETDGGIEPVDVLKICGSGFTKLGMNINDDSLSRIYSHPLMTMYRYSGRSLCEECSSCSIRDVCGGGYLPHRYSRERKFDNPSVYCADLKKLILHVQERVVSSLPEALRCEIGLSTYAFNET